MDIAPCPACGTYCENTVADGRRTGAQPCPGVDAEVYITRYRCDGHPLNAKGPIPCGWEGVLPGSDLRDPSCPSCGGWVQKVGAAQLRRVK